MAKERTCLWEKDDPDYEDETTWVTQCNQSFVLIDGSPADNDMNYCCYCGGKLIMRDK